MWRRILLHLTALLAVAALGLAGGAWWTWRQIQQERRAGPQVGQVLSGMVMNVRADGRLEILQWNGRKVGASLAGLRAWGRPGVVWLIDHATRQSVEVRVLSVTAPGQVEGEVTYLGLNLGIELLRAGMAERAPAPPGSRLFAGFEAAEAEARNAGRGCWAPGAGSSR